MTTLIYGETRINTSTNGFQEQPSVTGMSDGGYLLTWSGQGTVDADFIFAQRYDASGAKVGGQAQINTTTAGVQEDSVVTALANGRYVVAWKSDAQNDNNREIIAQIFDANGSKVGSEQLVNSNTSYSQDSASLTSLKDGGYLAAWASEFQDGSDWGCYLQRFDANGAKIGGEIRINTTTPGTQDGPKLTGLSDGGYMAVWEGYGSGDDYGIFAQRYNANGATVGGETRINTITTDFQGDAAITALTNGGYVVSWQSYPDDHDDNDETQAPGDIYAQLFNASGVAVGSQTLVNTTSTGVQEEPHITAMRDGGYLVTWNGNGNGDDYGIFAQRFNASGTKVGGETRINTTTAGNQEFADVTTLSDGGYLITWESYTPDGLSCGVYAQRFDANGNKLTGLSGDDQANTLSWSGTGSVIIDAGAGNDSLTGGISNDYLNGGLGNDILKGGAGADRMIGGDGSDLYLVDNVGDIVSETNAVASTGGNDTVYSSLATFTLGANLENLRILASSAANGIGNSLSNQLYAGAGNNTLDGAGGLDTANYSYASNAVTVSLATTTAQATGGSGSDTLLNIENLTGSNYNDNLTGNASSNILSGGAGNDTLNGGAGTDRLAGGDGSDLYYVDNTGDIVSETNAVASTGGNDTVYSSLATFTLGANLENLRILTGISANGIGNSLNNQLYAGSGNNTLNGAAGIDTANYTYAGSGVTVNLTSTTAQITGGSGSDTLVDIENLAGSSYNDSLTGNTANNTLSGGAGNDTLSGNAGNDLLVGGIGVDMLNGGTGADRFDFNAIAEMGLGALRDAIGDFKTSEGDKIDLSTVDANTTTTTDDTFSFIGSSAFSGDATGQLRFANGILYGSTDADTTAEFEIQLLGVSTFSSSDLIA